MWIQRSESLTYMMMRSNINQINVMQQCSVIKKKKPCVPSLLKVKCSFPGVLSLSNGICTVKYDRNRTTRGRVICSLISFLSLLKEKVCQRTAAGRDAKTRAPSLFTAMLSLDLAAASSTYCTAGTLNTTFFIGTWAISLVKGKNHLRQESQEGFFFPWWPRNSKGE